MGGILSEEVAPAPPPPVDTAELARRLAALTAIAEESAAVPDGVPVIQDLIDDLKKQHMASMCKDLETRARAAHRGAV